MTQENVKKIGFFKRIYLSIKEFEQYVVFATENLSVTIKYLLGIMAVFVLVVAGIFMYQFHNSFSEAINYFKENIEEVYFSKGELEVNGGKELEAKNDNSVLQYVLINTNASEEEIKKYEDKLNTFQNGIIILKDKIIYKNEMLAQNIQYKYEDIIANYPIGDFNKQDIINFISNIDITSLYVSVFIVMFIYLYIIYTATTFVDVVMLGVLGYIIARIAGMKIRFKATFNIGVHAITLPIVLNLIYIIVNSLTGFKIQYFNWMYTTISYIYVIVAIFMIRADFIGKQAELMKIIEEQEKVRQEMIKKEERKQEDKDENKDNKEKEPKEEKKREKNKEEKPVNNDGLAPQEVNNLPNNE